jgi:hypothetical protein
MNDKTHKLIKGFSIYLAASLLIGVPFALLNGIWPRNITGWIIICLFGFPTIILGEFLGEKLFSERISSTLDPTKRDKVFSARRMAYALVISMIVTALVFLLGYLLRAHIVTYFTIV